MDRPNISKSLRFEVLKRDRFRCTYCGAVAPDAVLHLDHVVPVIDGGSTDLLNLVTACASCNLGKGARQLSDMSAVEKQRAGLEETCERREQLLMLLEWRKELQAFEDMAAMDLAQYWQRVVPGWAVSEAGLANLRKWSREFSPAAVLKAMDAAALQYVEIDSRGVATRESWERAFCMLPAICRVDRKAETDPDIRRVYYIRGILRNRLTYCNETRALELLEAARSWGISLDELESLAKSARSWTQFREQAEEAILACVNAEQAPSKASRSVEAR